MRSAVPFLLVGALALVVYLVIPQSGDAPANPQAPLSDVLIGRNPQNDQYVQFAVVMLAIGGLLFGYFVWYEVTTLSSPDERRTIPQICVAAIASVLLGYGNFFLFTAAGVYA